MEAGGPKAEAMLTLGEHLQSRSANVSWLSAVVSILAPDHEIFQKNYVFVRPRQVESAAESDFEIANPSGFFNGLPLANSNSRGRRQRGIRLPKGIKAQVERKGLEKCLRKMERKVAAMKLALMASGDDLAESAAGELRVSFEGGTSSGAGVASSDRVLMQPYTPPPPMQS